MLALVYLFCVMAPSLAFAVSDGSRAAPCLVEDEHGLGIVHVHHQETGAAHVHADEHSHHHAGAGSGSDDQQLAQASPDDSVPAGGHRHKSADGTCCGMVCVSALPAAVLDLSKPSAPASRCAAETYRRLADDPLPTPYRPPNS